MGKRFPLLFLCCLTAGKRPEDVLWYIPLTACASRSASGSLCPTAHNRRTERGQSQGLSQALARCCNTCHLSIRESYTMENSFLSGLQVG
jgi:hypothetical protein